MKRLAGPSLLVLGMALALAPQADANEPLAVILNWTPSGDHAPLYWARAQGWYEEAGIDLTIETGSGSAVSAQRAGLGTTPIGITDLGTAMIAKGRGADLVSVFTYMANSPYRFYWRKSSGITGLDDLVGRNLGNPPGDAARIMWPALARANGIDPDSVSWVNIAPNAKVPALVSGAIDATTYFANYHYVVEGALGDDTAWLAWPDAGVNPYSLSYVVNREFMEANEDLVRAFVEVTQRAYHHCIDHAEDCVNALTAAASGLQYVNEAENWRITVNDLMDDAHFRERALGWVDAERIAADYELVSTFFEIEQPFDPEDIYTNRFLDTEIRLP